MITNIAIVALYVTDQERSRVFYTGKLGFEVTTDADNGPLGRWLEVAPKGAQTAFALCDAARYEAADRVGKSNVTLQCPDVQALHADLVAKDVAVTDVASEPWGTFLTITDPDGHELLVSQK
jgi:catechol 2,3-dioxygenase-like lactoylglutathione lyase family enzyme